MDLEKWTDAAKLVTKVAAPIALASGFLLLGPRAVVDRLGVDELLGSYRGWLGGTFALTASMTVFNVGAYGVGALRSIWETRQAKAAGTDHLKDLTPAEKNVLRRYMLGDTRTVSLDIRSGVAAALRNSGIIYRATSVGDMVDGFAFNIHDWARIYLQRNPTLLEGAEVEPKYVDPATRPSRRRSW